MYRKQEKGNWSQQEKGTCDWVGNALMQFRNKCGIRRGWKSLWMSLWAWEWF